MRAVSAKPSWFFHRDGSALTGLGIVIGVIDSGWDRTITDARVIQGISFVDPADGLNLQTGRDDVDRIGHGTACINLVLALAPQARIVPIRVFGSTLESSPDIVEAAIDWGISRRVDVLNLSLSTSQLEARDRLYRACARAAGEGILVVASTQNRRSISYPADFDAVISVGMATWSDPLVFSYHPGEAVECRSPGLGRFTRGLQNAPVTVTGNSYAAPNIAAIAALWRERWPQIDLEGTRDRLAAFATRIGPTRRHVEDVP